MCLPAEPPRSSPRSARSRDREAAGRSETVLPARSPCGCARSCSASSSGTSPIRTAGLTRSSDQSSRRTPPQPDEQDVSGPSFVAGAARVGGAEAAGHAGLRLVSEPEGLKGAPQASGMHRARVSAVAYFAVLGVSDGVWLARIPAVKHNLNLSDGLLGVALLAAPAGVVLVAIAAGRLVDRFGSARPTLLAGVAVALLPVALGLAGSLATLTVALFAFGVAAGLLDMSVHPHAGPVRPGDPRPLIPSLP